MKQNFNLKEKKRKEDSNQGNIIKNSKISYKTLNLYDEKVYKNFKDIRTKKEDLTAIWNKSCPPKKKENKNSQSESEEEKEDQEESDSSRETDFKIKKANKENKIIIDSDDSSQSKKNHRKKKKSIDNIKQYKLEPEEKFKTIKKPIKSIKNFGTDMKPNDKQDKIYNKIQGSSESESNSGSQSSNKDDKNSSNSSLSNKNKNEKKKKVYSSSSRSSYSEDSNDNEISEKEINIIIPEEQIEIKDKEKEIPKSLNEDKKFLKDKKENEDNQKTEIILKEISENLKDCKGQLEKEIEEIKKHKDFFTERNFILTDLSSKRMAQIIHYIKSGNPVLLEGDTGTAKTRTSVIACEYLMEYDDKYKEINKKDKKCKKNVNYIKFNLSADTKIDNLMNKYVGDNKSVSGIKIEKGSFLKAFIEGKILILDEINLASKEVLDCIGQALDSKVLSTELTGEGLQTKLMNENFALIATQNPLKGSFLNKRQNLGYAFFSRFQKVNCEKFNEDELFEIAKGLAKKENIEINDDILKDIIKFHMEWEKICSKDSEDIFCFTIREIETVLNALKDKNISPYSIIMNTYAARYPKKEKEKIKSLINKYINLKKKENEKENPLPKSLICFKNDNLIQAINSTLFSLNNHRHVIIVGEEGSGITQIARWSAEIFSHKYSEKEYNNKNEPFLCICSKKLQCEDLIGITMPNIPNKYDSDASETDAKESDKNNNEILKFKEGFLVKAIKNGRCAIFDQINEAPSTVYERLNGLLDKKYNDEDNTFPIPEYSEKTNPKINRNFRIICTCNHSKLKNISPAFLSRFDIIYLENQLDNIKEYKNLVDKIFQKLENFEKDEREKKKRKRK